MKTVEVGALAEILGRTPMTTAERLFIMSLLEKLAALCEQVPAKENDAPPA